MHLSWGWSLRKISSLTSFRQASIFANTSELSCLQSPSKNIIENIVISHQSTSFQRTLRHYQERTCIGQYVLQTDKTKSHAACTPPPPSGGERAPHQRLGPRHSQESWEVTTVSQTSGINPSFSVIVWEDGKGLRGLRQHHSNYTIPHPAFFTQICLIKNSAGSLLHSSEATVLLIIPLS